MILSKLEHAQSLQLCLFATPWTGACWVPQSMGFSKQEYWSWLPCLPLGDLPDPGIKSASLISYIQLLYYQRHLGSSLKLNMGQLKTIKKNTFESVLMRWMKMEPIIQSEVSQKEKHQFSILTHIYGIQKDGNNNPVYETAKETLMYRTVLWTLWERERVGRFGRMALKHV